MTSCPNVIGDVRAAADCGCFSAKLFRQAERLGDVRLLFFGHHGIGAAFDVECDPLNLRPRCHPCGGANKAVGIAALINANE